MSIHNKLFLLFALLLPLTGMNLSATEISDHTFLISTINEQNVESKPLWDFIQGNDAVGIQLKLSANNQRINLGRSGENFSIVLEKTKTIVQENPSKIIPVFLEFDGDILLLDSVINQSKLAPYIFYLPQGEAWPSLEYLVQANRRVVFFVKGNFENESRILHVLRNYALQISADKPNVNTSPLSLTSNVNLELFAINNFDKLPTEIPPNQSIRNLVPDYINFLLESWKKFGKKPNFIFVGTDIFKFDFIVDQLNSFIWIKGQINVSGKNLEEVFWRNPDVLVTGGHFSFPYRGGEEITLSPFAPGFRMIPEQIIVTGEMAIPESYSIIATPLDLSEGITGNFTFDGEIKNKLAPELEFVGDGYSFIRDIERGEVLRLPENASINLGNPENYSLRNSSFTVSCFVKFTEILEFGDNAILGNYETGYRRGLHLILRSGHPYFGLWANDFVSDVKLQSNKWYHLTWRYIIETGEQSIFLNGQSIGGSDGHPPYSGTGDIHLGSALSSGASLRGYVDNLRFWNRPLGNEEINRLSLDEEIQMKEIQKTNNSLFLNKWIWLGAGIIVIIILFFIFKKKKAKPASSFELPIRPKANQILLFGEFKAINVEGESITDFFTPKIKELFLFCLIDTLKNGIGANVSDIKEALWPGISDKKATNNRSVTLNKLRKILQQFQGIDILSNSGRLVVKTEAPFFCDYVEAFALCKIPHGLDRHQLITFFDLVKRGRFLKGTSWPWLDDIRGFIGNQVIDNLLKLASIYKNEGNLKEIEKVAQRILDYDDLNEEAIYLQIWALQKANNLNLAKFNFNLFTKKYETNFAEPYPMNFAGFNQHFDREFS